jgi:hypothetical protein
MGCDIHSHAERRVGDGWEAIPGLHPFDWRSYGMYGFLAGVRNYSAVPEIAPKRGVPDDLSAGVRGEYDGWDSDAHSASWLSVEELTAFDYNQVMEDRRVTRQTASNVWDGGCTAAPGEGETMTYREFLGDAFFADLEKLKAAGAERVVFWFDN